MTTEELGVGEEVGRVVEVGLVVVMRVSRILIEEPRLDFSYPLFNLPALKSVLYNLEQ